MQKLNYTILNKPEYKFTQQWTMNRRTYQLLDGVDIEINGKIYHLEKGFIWDGWSIPPIAIKFFDLIFDLIPPLFHDFFYETAGLYPEITRRIADDLLKQTALDRGCRKHEVRIAYIILRVWSGHIWCKYKKHNLGIEEIPSGEYSHINFNPHKKAKQ